MYAVEQELLLAGLTNLGEFFFIILNNIFICRIRNTARILLTINHRVVDFIVLRIQARLFSELSDSGNFADKATLPIISCLRTLCACDGRNYSMKGLLMTGSYEEKVSLTDIFEVFFTIKKLTNSGS